MRLPGTEQWSEESIGAQIAFEKVFAESAPSLLEVIDAADRDREPERTTQRQLSESIFALGRAAELAFATEQVQRGISICKLMMTSEGPKTPMQLAFYATVGALIGAVRIHLNQEGALIERRALHLKDILLSWPHDDSAYVVRLMRHFLPAAAASGPLFEMIGGLVAEQQVGMKPQVMASLGASIELQSFLGDFKQLQAIQVMEENYATRLSLMRNDSFHWHSMQPKGAIIDWPLLCVWVGIFRFGGSALLQKMVPASETAAFIRWLAHELSSVRGQIKF
jgi:hypothetical protein